MRWFADSSFRPTKVGVMRRLLTLTVTALIVACAVPVTAGNASAGSKPQSTHAQSKSQQASKAKSRVARPARVYGSPIQPPIVKKRAGKRNTAKGVAASTDSAAKRKAHAEAQRKARANLEYRRANPASAGPQR